MTTGTTAVGHGFRDSVFALHITNSSCTHTFPMTGSNRSCRMVLNDNLDINMCCVCFFANSCMEGGAVWHKISWRSSLWFSATEAGYGKMRNAVGKLWTVDADCG